MNLGYDSGSFAGASGEGNGGLEVAASGGGDSRLHSFAQDCVGQGITSHDAVMAYGRRRGFTLIELLVVVAIIALLVSILLPSLNRAKELTKRVVCATHLSNILKAANLYSTEYNGVFPIDPNEDGTPSNSVNTLWCATQNPKRYFHLGRLVGRWSDSEGGFVGKYTESQNYICPSAPLVALPAIDCSDEVFGAVGRSDSSKDVKIAYFMRGANQIFKKDNKGNLNKSLVAAEDVANQVVISDYEVCKKASDPPGKKALSNHRQGVNAGFAESSVRFTDIPEGKWQSLDYPDGEGGFGGDNGTNLGSWNQLSTGKTYVP